MSSLLKKNSAKTQVSVNKEDTKSAGLPDDVVVLLGNPEGKLFKEMEKAAKKMNLTMIGKAYGPYRITDAANKAIASKKSR